MLIDPAVVDPAAANEASPPLRVEWPDERAKGDDQTEPLFDPAPYQTGRTRAQR